MTKNRISPQSLIRLELLCSLGGTYGKSTKKEKMETLDFLHKQFGISKNILGATPGDRLTINGRIYSYNTRGGSLMPSGTDIIDATTPQIFSASGVLGSATLPITRSQDLERLRSMFTDGEATCSLRLNYYAYTTATLPLLLQRPAGYTGGNCGF